jgi:hypothetical protein
LFSNPKCGEAEGTRPTQYWLIPFFTNLAYTFFKTPSSWFYSFSFAHQRFIMSPPDTATIVDILNNGPHRIEEGRKQLTLAFGGLYIVATTATARPYLVWEQEKGYARYYAPVEALQNDIKRSLSSASSSVDEPNGHTAAVTAVENVKGKANDSQAIIERLVVGSKTTTWVRFVGGPLNGLIRFERSEIGG